MLNRTNQPDAMDRYFGGVKSENKEYQKKTSRQKYAKVQEYLDFKTGIWDAMYPDTPMPPLTNFIEKGPKNSWSC